jgi:hypothetical protein
LVLVLVGMTMDERKVWDATRDDSSGGQGHALSERDRTTRRRCASIWRTAKNKGELFVGPLSNEYRRC